MKKYLFIIILILLVSGCKKNKEEKPVQKISSKGQLMCISKIDYTNQNVIYTSYYLFNFNDNGILKGASNVESVQFSNTPDHIKDKYKDELNNVIKEYKDIDGVEVKKDISDEKYSFEVSLDNTKMDEETKENFLLNLDRISLYKLYTSEGYTCE